MSQTIDANDLREKSKAMAALCLSSNLRKLERMVTRHYDSFVSASGVTAVQLPLLTSMFLNPNLTLNQQAEILQVERTTLWRNLRPLIRDDLVIEHNERRPARYELTSRGSRRLARAVEQWRRAHDEMEQLLGATTKNLHTEIRKASSILQQTSD